MLRYRSVAPCDVYCFDVSDVTRKRYETLTISCMYLTVRFVRFLSLSALPEVSLSLHGVTRGGRHPENTPRYGYLLLQCIYLDIFSCLLP